MALSPAFVENHIDHWTNELSSGFRSYRKHWPQCLFHHAPLESALAILRDGNIRARNDPLRQHLHDVAAPGVIDNRVEAHDRVRLYFRPRTPTQFHIEGIRKDGECKYGPGAHAPVLVMFVLDAKSILTLPDIMFSDRNMQSYGARTGEDEDFFASIPFQWAIPQSSPLPLAGAGHDRDGNMREQEIRGLIGRVKRGAMSRRDFVQRMIAVGLTAPMAGTMLAHNGVAFAQSSFDYLFVNINYI